MLQNVLNSRIDMLRNMCEDLETCSIQAPTSVFGELCTGSMYLAVEYRCYQGKMIIKENHHYHSL